MSKTNHGPITAADIAGVIGSRKARELLGIEPVGSVKPNKRHKYGAGPKEKRTLDGIVFDSEKEMKRWKELLLFESAGKITELERQVIVSWHIVYSKLPGGDGDTLEDSEKYVCDFRYVENGSYVWEDVKKMNEETYRRKTSRSKANRADGSKAMSRDHSFVEYLRKKRIVRALFGIEVMET